MLAYFDDWGTPGYPEPWLSSTRWEPHKVKTCFFTKSVKFGFGELSISQICAESRDLQSGHGFRACSFKNKRKKLDFHTCWDQTTEKKRNSGTKSGEIRSPEV